LIRREVVLRRRRWCRSRSLALRRAPQRSVSARACSAPDPEAGLLRGRDRAGASTRDPGARVGQVAGGAGTARLRQRRTRMNAAPGRAGRGLGSGQAGPGRPADPGADMRSGEVPTAGTAFYASTRAVATGLDRPRVTGRGFEDRGARVTLARLEGAKRRELEREQQPLSQVLPNTLLRGVGRVGLGALAEHVVQSRRVGGQNTCSATALALAAREPRCDGLSAGYRGRPSGYRGGPRGCRGRLGPQATCLQEPADRP
jgi:hypothetical protein